LVKNEHEAKPRQTIPTRSIQPYSILLVQETRNEAKRSALDKADSIARSFIPPKLDANPLDTARLTSLYSALMAGVELQVKPLLTPKQSAFKAVFADLLNAAGLSEAQIEREASELSPETVLGILNNTQQTVDFIRQTHSSTAAQSRVAESSGASSSAADATRFGKSI
jgi:hypothetical protein